jgi:hypothetical protein
VYDYITKSYSTQSEVIINHANPNVHGTAQRKARHKKYKRLKLGGGQVYGLSADQLQLRHTLLYKRALTLASI